MKLEDNNPAIAPPAWECVKVEAWFTGDSLVFKITERCTNRENRMNASMTEYIRAPRAMLDKALEGLGYTTRRQRTKTSTR